MMRARRRPLTRIAGIAGILAGLVSVLAFAGPASAQEELTAGELDSSAFPTLEVVVSLPGTALEAATDPANFSVLEPTGSRTPEVVPFATTDLDVVLLVDTSGSMRGAAMDSAKAAAAAFIDQLPASSRIAVVGFGPTPDVASSLTADRDALAEAVATLSASGETALYDAVVVATAEIAAETTSRTALVVLSDGGDTVSSTTLETAAAVSAERFDVVHAISLVTSEQDNTALGALVSGGGAVVRAEDPIALAGVYSDVADRILNQYTLRWESELEATGTVLIAFADGTRTFAISREVTIEVVGPDTDATPANDGTVAPEPAPTTPPNLAAEPEAAAPATIVTPDTMPDWVRNLGLLAVAAAFFILGLVLFGPREKTRNLAKEFRERLPGGRELTGVGQRIVDSVEKVLRRDPERKVGIALRLEQAGLDWSPAEFVAMLATGGAILALVGFAIVGVIGIVVAPFFGILAMLLWIDQRAQRRSKLFTEQLDGTLQLMSGSLRSGFGIMQALGTVAEESEWPTNEEFTRVLGEVRLGRDLGDALNASARRIDCDDYDWAVQAIEISREVGGNLAEVLDNVSQTIRQRNTLRREVRALSAEGRVSAVILFALPFLMLAWMRVTNGEYANLLFTRTGGQIAVGIGVFLMISGALWIRKIVQVEF